MRIRLSELRAIIRRVIAESKDGFQLQLTTYKVSNNLSVVVLTNGYQILLRKDEVIPNTQKPDPILNDQSKVTPRTADPKKLFLGGFTPTTSDLEAYDPSGVEKLRKASLQAA